MDTYKFLAQFDPKSKASPAGQIDADKFLAQFKPLSESTNQQKAGFVPTREDLINMLPKLEEIPAMVGSLAGLAAKETIPGAALAAVGAAGAEGYSQLAQRAGVMSGEPPATAGEALSRMGKKALSFGAGEIIGRKIINPVISRIGKSIMPGAGEATQAAVAAAESEGIKPLPSMVFKSKAVAGTERALEYSPFGTAITKAREKVVEDFGDYAQRVGESIGPDKPAEVNGALIKEATQGYYDKFNDVKKKLYDFVMPQLKDKPVALDNTLATLEGIVARNSGPGQRGGSAFFQNLLEDIKPKAISEAPAMLASSAESSVKTFGELKQLGTNVGARAKFFDPSNPGLQGDMKALWAAIAEDKDKAINLYGDESTKQALAKANEYYSTGKTILKSKIYKALIASPQGNEYKIAFNPRDPLAYDTVKEVVGQDAMGGLSRQWFEDVLSKSTRNGMTSPQLILNNLDKQASLLHKITEDFPEAGAQIAKLRQIATQLTKNSDVMKGSQTGALQTGLFGIGAALYKIASSVPELLSNPVHAATGIGVGVGVLGASKSGASLFTSDFLRDLLTKGYSSIQRPIEKSVKTVVTPSTGLYFSRRNKNK